MEQDKAKNTGRDGAPKQRVDWRTGKPMLCRDAAFWLEHERLRLQAGLSMPQYCKANGLALSTYRHRVNGQRGQGSRATVRQPGAAVAEAKFVVISTVAPSAEAASAQVNLGGGVTVHFGGAAADALLQHVLARLP